MGQDRQALSLACFLPQLSNLLWNMEIHLQPVSQSLRFKTRGELRNLDHLRAGLRMLKVSEGLRNGTMWNEDMTERKSWYCEGCRDKK